MKRILMIVVVLLAVIDSHALSEQQEQVQKLIARYYETLAVLSRQPSPDVEQQIMDLFVDGGFVYNDLYMLENKQANGIIKENQESDISEYIGTIRNLWAKNIQLDFQGKVDAKSYVELNEPALGGKGEKAIWITVTKYVTNLGKPIGKQVGAHETFKIKGGKIQSIRLPEDATCEINFYLAWADKDYNKAFNSFRRSISKGKDCDEIALQLIVELLMKGKVKGLPTNVQKWLALFYEARYSKYPFVLYNSKWRKRDFAYLMRDSINSTPFVHGLMPIFKGGKRIPSYADVDIDGEKYGYMNEQGKMVTPYKFSWAEPFSEEYRVARVGLGTFGIPYSKLYFTTYGVINLEGDVLTKKEYLEIRPFHDGLAAVKNTDRQWGFINTKGEEIVPCSYKSVTDYRCGWYGCSNGEESMYLSLDGNRINDRNYWGVWTFNEKSKLAFVSSMINGQEFVGCIDVNGNQVVPTEYYSISIDSDCGTMTLQKTINSEKITMQIPTK